MITRGDGEVRVERSERRAVTNTAALAVVTALVLAYLFPRLHSPPQLALAALVAALVAAACVLVYRPRPVLVIAPQELRVEDRGRIWSVRRGELGSARVVAGVFTQLLLHDRQGRRLRTVGLTYFSAAEVRQALREAGIRGR
jgi:multisubunit Na+/H+ antiporter MnhB subunit